MKNTDFRFELRVADDEPTTTLVSLEAKLQTIKGINSLTFTRSKSAIEFTLNASFEDGEQAKNLHRKVINSIMAHEGVTISQVETTLTDIF
ncbi:hypothetical protein AB1L42_04785 [Thalassoglobus sp. JC818]|uniref:hypothetical protein n=1 Tax=Thalassoglobus sp. JC818 TaxID=3232136 RepID=UPI00345A1DA0